MAGRRASGEMCSDFYRAESGTEVRGAGVKARETRTGLRAGAGGPRAREARALRRRGARGPDAGDPGAPSPKLAPPGDLGPSEGSLRTRLGVKWELSSLWRYGPNPCRAVRHGVQERLRKAGCRPAERS